MNFGVSRIQRTLQELERTKERLIVLQVALHVEEGENHPRQKLWERAAAKRATMDLTRALASFRKGG